MTRTAFGWSYAILLLLCSARSSAAFTAGSPFKRDEVYSTPLGVHAIVSGDFNGDGFLDLATTNSSSEHNGGLGLTLYMNQGGHGFSDRQDYLTGLRPFGATAADLNGDGFDDLAIATYYAEEISVRYALGDGGFSAPTGYRVSGQPWSVIAGDFLGDGTTDLVANHYNISLLEGVSSGGFAAAAPLNTGTNGYGNLVSGDFNRDGRLDLAQTTGSHGHVQVFFGQSGGGLGMSQLYPAGPNADALAAGDLNNDGWLDLVVSNWLEQQLTVLLAQPEGGFEIGPQYSLSKWPQRIAIGDLDNDGLLDVAATETINESGFLTLWRNIGGGNLAELASIPIVGEGDGIVMADFNRDGGLDVAVTASTQGVRGPSFSVLYNAIPEPRGLVLAAVALACARRGRTSHLQSQRKP
jgi:hypothetical protein